MREYELVTSPGTKSQMREYELVTSPGTKSQTRECELVMSLVGLGPKSDYAGKAQ
jgi:hypothetical protein